MKFKYIGQLPIKSADLVLAKIFKTTDIITNGTVFEVPDDDTILIQRIKCTGYYEEYSEPKKIIAEPKKVGRPKKDKEEKENNKED